MMILHVSLTETSSQRLQDIADEYREMAEFCASEGSHEVAEVLRHLAAVYDVELRKRALFERRSAEIERRRAAHEVERVERDVHRDHERRARPWNWLLGPDGTAGNA